MPDDSTLILIDPESDYVACPGCADVSMRAVYVPADEPVRIFCDFCDILILDQAHSKTV